MKEWIWAFNYDSLVLAVTHLRDAFSESNIPYKVDVVDWATTDPVFRAIIEKDRIILQSAANP